MIFVVLTTVTIKITDLLDVTTCGTVDTYQHFGGICLNLQGSILKTETAGSSETFVITCQVIYLYIRNKSESMLLRVLVYMFVCMYTINSLTP
jgi:hypothetical protein